MLNSIFQFNDFNRERFVAKIAADLPPGTKVLDAGAGSCRYKIYFSECEYKAQDFAKYTGADHKYGELDYVSDITAIPVPDSSFDFVLCTEVLEHVPDPISAIKEFSRVLRSGGKLVITAPLGSFVHMPPYHYYGGFSTHWYEYFFPKLGLKLEHVIQNGGFFSAYGQESQRFLTYLTPGSAVARLFFFPVKLVLAIWFRLLMPFICAFLDQRIRTEGYTVGYFVVAKKS